MKLSTLTFATFNGEPLQRTPFLGRFPRRCGWKRASSPSGKFAYLRGKLEGGALAAVAGLPLTNVNHSVAVHLIRKRFGVEQRIINAYFRAIVDLPAATTSSSLKSVFDTKGTSAAWKSCSKTQSSQSLCPR